MKPDFTSLIDDLTLSYCYRPALKQLTGLIILMHGVGSNEQSLLALARYIPEDYSVVLVRSPLTMAPGAYAAFAVSFTADGPKIDAAAAENSRQKLLRFIPELQLRYGIPAERTLIGGFSQGGIMSAGLALTAPKNVRGFAVLSGRILPEIRPIIASAKELKHLSALVVHGDADDRLPVHLAVQSTALLEELGLPFRSLRYPMGHEITREVATDFANWVCNLLP